MVIEQSVRDAVVKATSQMTTSTSPERLEALTKSALLGARADMEAKAAVKRAEASAKRSGRVGTVGKAAEQTQPKAVAQAAVVSATLTSPPGHTNRDPTKEQLASRKAQLEAENQKRIADMDAQRAQAKADAARAAGEVASEPAVQPVPSASPEAPSAPIAPTSDVARAADPSDMRAGLRGQTALFEGVEVVQNRHLTSSQYKPFLVGEPESPENSGVSKIPWSGQVFLTREFQDKYVVNQNWSCFEDGFQLVSLHPQGFRTWEEEVATAREYIDFSPCSVADIPPAVGNFLSEMGVTVQGVQWGSPKGWSTLLWKCPFMTVNAGDLTKLSSKRWPPRADLLTPAPEQAGCVVECSCCLGSSFAKSCVMNVYTYLSDTDRKIRDAMKFKRQQQDGKVYVWKEQIVEQWLGSIEGHINSHRKDEIWSRLSQESWSNVWEMDKSPLYVIKNLTFS